MGAKGGPGLHNPLCPSQELVLTRTTTTCTDTCSGSRMGARKCMAKATRRWRMEIRFLPWMAAGNKGKEVNKRILTCYFKHSSGGKGSEKCFWSTQSFFFYLSSSFSWISKAYSVTSQAAKPKFSPSFKSNLQLQTLSAQHRQADPTTCFSLRWRTLEKSALSRLPKW